jgi:protein-S-isoprenylcysteine O-methyltransferase Ste14
VQLTTLVGSGDRIGAFVLPFVVVGVAANLLFPSVFDVGGPPEALRLLSIVVLAIGLVVWAWTAALILRDVPRGELVTTGPYAVVKHPLYTGVAVLVLPWAGFLLDSWLGVLLGAALYVGHRLFSGAEEAELARRFGDRWDRYAASVLLPRV